MQFNAFVFVGFLLLVYFYFFFTFFEPCFGLPNAKALSIIPKQKAEFKFENNKSFQLCDKCRA